MKGWTGPSADRAQTEQSQKSALFLHVGPRPGPRPPGSWLEIFHPCVFPGLRDQRGEMFSDVGGALQRRISSIPGNLWSKVAGWSHLT